MKEMIIYCCGDSHTAGGETVDDLLWPDQHPGFMNYENCHLRDPRQHKRWQEYRERKLKQGDPVTHHQWLEMEKTKSWPAHLGKITGLPTINGSKQGASMEWVHRQTVCDLAELLDQHSSITAMIMPPHHLRMQYYSRTNSWNSIQMANNFGVPAAVHEWLVLNEDDISLMTRWLISMIGIITFANLHEIRVILLDSSHCDTIELVNNRPELGKLRDIYLRMTKDLWYDKNFRQISESVNDPICPDWHWRREVHQGLAEDLSRLF
jgi:hypothetical protein